MAVVIRGLRDFGELEKLYSLYSKVFLKTPLPFFTKRINNDPYMVLSDFRVAEEVKEIVSSVAVIRRKMHWKGGSLPFAGIGNVSTLPEKRDHGFSSMLMNDALKYIKDNFFEVSILFTGINPFYERFNYFTIKSYYLTFHVPDEEERTKYNIRNFTENDLNKVSVIYDRFNKNLCGPIDRDTNYWKANLKFAEDNEIFLLAEYQNEIDGYVRIVPSVDKNEIWEFGFTDIEALNALLHKTAKLLNKHDLKTMSLCPLDFIKDEKTINITYEPNSIAMAFITGNTDRMIDRNEFDNYCFWWTDNF
jgi:predicted acetyltransferase